MPQSRKTKARFLERIQRLVDLIEPHYPKGHGPKGGSRKPYPLDAAYPLPAAVV